MRAYKFVTEGKKWGSRDSREPNDTQKTSPVIGFKGYKK